MEGGRTALDNKTSLLNTPPPRSFAGPRFREYNPYNYTDGISTMDKAALKEALYEDAVEQLREGGTLGQKLCRSVCPAASVKIQFFCLSRPTLQAAGRKVWKTRS